VQYDIFDFGKNILLFIALTTKSASEISSKVCIKNIAKNLLRC